MRSSLNYSKSVKNLKDAHASGDNKISLNQLIVSSEFSTTHTSICLVYCHSITHYLITANQVFKYSKVEFK